MAFPVGWGRRCALVIQSNKVDANQSDFPVLLTKDTLPSEMFDHDGSYPALEGGGDIRFSSDEGGNTQLACEVVSFSLDDANNEAEIWVKVPSVSSSTDTTFYCWYSKAAETQPAADSTYGSENVWDSNFVMVQHMNQDPSGSAPQMIDSTGNDNDGTSQGSMTSGDLVDGKIGKALDFDGSNDCFSIGDLNFNTFNAITFSALVKTTLDSAIFSDHDPNNYYESVEITTDGFTINSSSDSSTRQVVTWVNSPKSGSWCCLDCVWDGQSSKTYFNGNFDNSGNAPNPPWNTSVSLYIASRRAETSFFDGLIDELQISNIARSAEWIDASYNNQFSPGTFIIEGTPATPVAPTSIFYGPLVGPFGGPI